jgi:AraC-like DNA-binding protein
VPSVCGEPDAAGVLRDDVLLEWYWYPPGPPVELPAHSHEQYQLNVSVGVPAGVHYRGGYHVVPAHSLAVIMPGEVHTPRDCDRRDDISSHLTLYVSPSALSGAVDGDGRLPFFRDLIVDAPDVVSRFVGVHTVLSGRAPGSALDQDVQLLALLADLVERYGGVRVDHPVLPAHGAVRRARDYLHAHFTANVTLAELAQVGGLSPYHLTRLFTAAVGLPPHAYQVQLRVDHAKRLLLDGRRGVSEAAHDAGFFDLSHFSRHFKRHVGVPPGVYARHAARSGRKSVHASVPAPRYRSTHAR